MQIHLLLLIIITKSCSWQNQFDPQNLIQQQGHIQGSWFKGFQTLHAPTFRHYWVIHENAVTTALYMYRFQGYIHMCLTVQHILFWTTHSFYPKRNMYLQFDKVIYHSSLSLGCVLASLSSLGIVEWLMCCSRKYPCTSGGWLTEIPNCKGRLKDWNFQGVRGLQMK